MNRYRKRPVVIEALLWGGSVESATRIIDWVTANGGTARYHEHVEPRTRVDAMYEEATHIAIDTLEGTMHAWPGWYVIKGVRGEFYACEPGIFEETYEKVEADE